MARDRSPKPEAPASDVASGQADPLLREMDKYVLEVLKGNDSARIKAQAANIGLKLLQIKHKIIGDTNEGSFFD